MAEERGKFVERGEDAPRHRREDLRRDLRHPEQVRGLRLQQVALRRLRAPQLPDGVPEGEPPRAVHGGHAQLRARQCRQGRAFRGRVRGDGPRASSGPTSTSRGRCSPRSGGKIRFGLAGIKGVGELAAQRIIAEREANGPFADFDDFATRVDGRAVNKRVLEHLVKTGAFDFSGAGRRSLFEGIDAAIAASSAQARDRAAGQDNFLGVSRGAGRGPERRARRERRPRTRNSAPTSASRSRRSFSASTCRATR